jgi:hypothetical protein
MDKEGLWVSTAHTLRSFHEGFLAFVGLADIDPIKFFVCTGKLGVQLQAFK